MAENQPPDADKTRRSRSFGSFLLFLLVLIAILFAVGGKLKKPTELTQDQFEWYLHRGARCHRRRGTNRVAGG